MVEIATENLLFIQISDPLIYQAKETVFKNQLLVDKKNGHNCYMKVGFINAKKNYNWKLLLDYIATGKYCDNN